jgi:hypothetical protein
VTFIDLGDNIITASETIETDPSETSPATQSAKSVKRFSRPEFERKLRCTPADEHSYTLADETESTVHGDLSSTKRKRQHSATYTHTHSTSDVRNKTAKLVDNKLQRLQEVGSKHTDTLDSIAEIRRKETELLDLRLEDQRRLNKHNEKMRSLELSIKEAELVFAVKRANNEKMRSLELKIKEAELVLAVQRANN